MSDKDGPKPAIFDQVSLNNPHYINMADIEPVDRRMDVLGTAMLTDVYNKIQRHNRVIERARTFHMIRAEYGNEAALRIVFMHYGLRRAAEKRGPE